MPPVSLLPVVPPVPAVLRALALGAVLAVPVGPWAAAGAVEGASGPYLAARQALSDNDFAAATGFLDALIAVDAENPVVLENAVVAHLALGDLAAALEPAQRIEALGVASQPARLAVIGNLLAEGDHDAALEELRDGAGIGPLIDPLLRGWTQLARGRMSEALAEFDSLTGQRGMEAFGLYHTALALAHVGDAEGAERILSGEVAGPLQVGRRGALARVQLLGALERREDAVALIDEMFGTDPDPEVAELRARLSGDAPVGFDIVASPRDGMAEVFHDIAGALQGEASDAFTLILARMALALRPDHVSAVLLTGRLLGALDQHGLAAEVHRQVPEEAPLYHMARIGLAEALERDGEDAAARAELEALVETHGHLAAVHITLGDLLRRGRAFDAASQAYDAAIALLGMPQRQHWVVYYTRAITHEREDRWDQAEADFRTALELSPDEPHVLNYLGYSLVERRENLDEALEMIRRAVEGEPDNGYIVDSLGWVYYRLGRHDEALRYMERAVELMPTDAILNDHLGDVYYALGRTREARFQWRRALSFGPADDLDMDRIRRKLEVGLDAVLVEEGAEPHHGRPDRGADRGADGAHGN